MVTREEESQYGMGICEAKANGGRVNIGYYEQITDGESK